MQEYTLQRSEKEAPETVRVKTYLAGNLDSVAIEMSHRCVCVCVCVCVCECVYYMLGGGTTTTTTTAAAAAAAETVRSGMLMHVEARMHTCWRILSY